MRSSKANCVKCRLEVEYFDSAFHHARPLDFSCARNGLALCKTQHLHAEVRAKIYIYQGKADVTRRCGDGMAFVRLCQFLRGEEESRRAADPVIWGDADASCRAFLMALSLRH